MTTLASFENRVEGLAGYTRALLRKGGFPAGVVVVCTVSEATLRFDLGNASAGRKTAFHEALRAAVRAVGLHLATAGAPPGCTVRARTDADRVHEREQARLLARARMDAREQAAVHQGSPSKLYRSRGDGSDLPPRAWAGSSFAECCAGIAEALEVLRLAVEKGTEPGRVKAAGVVVIIALASMSAKVRARAAMRLRELGRVEAEQLERLRGAENGPG